MACLAYHPSSIIFEGNVVPRAWLHERRSKIVEELYKDYNNLLPWKSGMCRFDKYLDVIVEKSISTMPNSKCLTPNKNTYSIMQRK
jgi:hypothetical protein